MIEPFESVHIAPMVECNKELINIGLERRMDIAPHLRTPLRRTAFVDKGNLKQPPNTFGRISAATRPRRVSSSYQIAHSRKLAARNLPQLDLRPHPAYSC